MVFYSLYYIIFYLVIPIIDFIVTKIDRKKYTVLLLLLICFFSILPFSYRLWHLNDNGVLSSILWGLSRLSNNGCNFRWLIILYIIGNYIKDVKLKISPILGFSLLFVVCNFTALMYRFGYSNVIDNTSPFVLAEAVIMLLTFSNIRETLI